MIAVVLIIAFLLWAVVKTGSDADDAEDEYWRGKR